MVLLSELSCSIFPANVPAPRRAAIRRRPKLLPPKNKCHSRARINLNEVWPFLDKNQPEMPSLSSPLQSSSHFNSNNHRPRNQRTPSRNIRGNDLINYTLDNIEKLSNFNHISSLKSESDHGDSENVPNDVQESLLQNQIHFYTSCSNINFKRAFEEASQQASHSPMQTQQSDSQYLINELSTKFPKISIDDLTDGNEKCDVHPNNNNGSRSAKKIRQDECARPSNTGYFEHKVAARQQCFNVHFMARLEQQQQPFPEDSTENDKENVLKNFRRDFPSGMDSTAISLTTTETEALPSLQHPPNLAQFR